MLKAGAFKIIGEKYGLSKLHKNTHLYTSQSLVEFPGKRYKVINYGRYKTKKVQELDLESAHVVARNFPDSVDTLRKRFKLKEGEEKTLIFTKGPSGELLFILCEKVSE